MNAILSSALSQALGWSLFHFLWQGALIAAVAAIALKFAVRAQTRYAIACCALIVMLAVFAVTLRLSIPQAPTVIARLNLPPALPAAIPPLDPVPASRDFSAYFEYAVPLWLAGVFCVLLYRSAAWIWATRLRRRGTCEVPEAWIGRMKLLRERARVWQPVVLLESCLAEVPVVIGYLRPAILIPAGMLTGLPAAHIEAILLHELAHLRRADYLVALLQSAIEGLLFYHPAVWWISGVIRAERENCCDDFAIAIQGDPHAYASALATIETRRWRAAEPVLAANQSDLLPRIRRVLRPSDQRSARDFSLPLIPTAMLLIAAGIAIADQAPQLATLPLKIPTPKVPDLMQPMLMAQAPVPAAPEQTEVGRAYQKWLKEEVVYIITDQERAAFKALATDQEREKFIEQFWLRRDPTPGTPENEFRDEHDRRIAYANSRFTAEIPGWKTDRGRIYIQYGPPDEIESHPTGGTYRRPAEEGGGTTNTFPFEQWRYRLIEGIGNNVIIEFVDTNRSGEYHMTMDPSEKDALLFVPGAGLSSTLQNAPLPGGHIYVDQTAPGPVVALAIPLGFTNPVNLYGRVRTSTGQPVTSFEEAVPSGAGPTYFKSVSLKSGSYVFSVAVKDLKSRATYVDSVNFDVK
jgi:GWxTD domain-containing protein